MRPQISLNFAVIIKKPVDGYFCLIEPTAEVLTIVCE